jgi:transposase
MESISVERLDHLGIVASVIKDLGLIEMIDARLGLHDQEEITAGEAIAGMILNGLGFSDRPLTLTPQFFANKPLDLLFREGVRAARFNRFKLGRTLEEAHAYGCDVLSIHASTISTPRVFPSLATLCPTAMCTPLPSRMAMPKITALT